jgi:hypothetical protein
MVRITKSFTIDIEKDGQRITIGPEEIQQIKAALEEASREKGREIRKTRTKVQSKSYISREKQERIMSHIGKRLSSKPQTLSSLLDGIPYAPNTMPAIRQMVKHRKDVGQKVVGKRTLYFKKGS